MPWYYNISPHVVPVDLADGSVFRFPARKESFVEDSKVSYAIVAKIEAGVLRLHKKKPDPVLVGRIADPVITEYSVIMPLKDPVLLPEVLLLPPVVLGIQEGMKSDTSSNLHLMHATVPPVADIIETVEDLPVKDETELIETQSSEGADDQQKPRWKKKR